MSDARDPRVDDYIGKLPDWQQAICREVRDLLHEADPGIEETIKRTVQPYFVLDGNVAALLAAKDHVPSSHDFAPHARPGGHHRWRRGQSRPAFITIHRGDPINGRR
jgi:hypothetical protein